MGIPRVRHSVVAVAAGAVSAVAASSASEGPTIVGLATGIAVYIVVLAICYEIDQAALMIVRAMNNVDQNNRSETR